MKYTLQQRVFIYATFVKTDSASDTRKIFKEEFPDISPPHVQTIRNIVTRFRESGTFDNYLTENKRVLTEETLDEIFSKLSNSPNKPLHLIAEEMGFKLHTLNTAIKMLQTKYKVKIQTKRRGENDNRKWYTRVMRKRQEIPVPVLPNLKMGVIECGKKNIDDEYVLPEDDDPLKITDSPSGNFEQVTLPSIKPEVKEEIVISDSDEDVIECIDDSDSDVIVEENSLDTETSS